MQNCLGIWECDYDEYEYSDENDSWIMIWSF